WFLSEARRRDLDVEHDANGNMFAWWLPDGGSRDAFPAEGAVVTGSHLDSVPGGGAFDGPLGVVSAFAAVDRLRERGARPRRPIGGGGAEPGAGRRARRGPAARRARRARPRPPPPAAGRGRGGPARRARPGPPLRGRGARGGDARACPLRRAPLRGQLLSE